MRFLLSALACAAGGWLLWRTSAASDWPCAIRGHRDLLTFGDGEIFMRCADCHRRTEGWQIGEKGKEVA